MKSIAIRTFVTLASVLISGMIPGIAAMDDVIVWNSARTQAQIENTLVNGYTSTTGMTMWWQFNNTGNLTYDTISSSIKGVIKGSPTSLVIQTPNDTFNRAASGFTSKDNCLAVALASNLWNPQTHEMWICNPQLNGSAVFWSISGSADGGGSEDCKRLSVNADGSITMNDRGYYTGWPSYTSGPLTWDPHKWYQVTVVMEYKGGPSYLVGVKVYRGAKGDASVTKLLDYDSSIPAITDFWMSVGAHSDGIAGVFPGGYLGSDTITTIAAAKQAQENTAVDIDGMVVSRAFSDFFYIQDGNSRVGICVHYTGAIPAAGTIVDVTGTVKTNADGELGINATSIQYPSGTGSAGPVGIGCSSVGGVACGKQSGTRIMKSGSIMDSVGANNIGLLVKTWGKITPVSSSRILISDGSGVELPVIAPPGYIFKSYYAPYPFVTATGVSSCEKVAGDVRPVIRLSALSDLSELSTLTPAPPTGRKWLGGLTDTGVTNLGNLLSDNRFFYGPSVLTGVTYTYLNTPANPGDSAPWPGRRLLDGQGAVDWNTVVGVASKPLVAIFDFKRNCTFTEVDIAPWNGEKNYVKLETSKRSGGPWTTVLERAKADAPGTCLERLPILGTPPIGRYLRLTIDGNSVNSLCEVWAWGSGTVDATYPEAINPIYSAQAAGYYSIPGIGSTSFTSTEFNTWKSQLGSYTNQPAVWSQVPTWNTITVGNPSAPILPLAASVLSGKTITIDMARNMTEQRAFAFTNTSLAEATMNVALGDIMQNGQIASNINGSLRVMASMPSTSTAGSACLFPLFSADNMLYSGLMARYFTNGTYISKFPSVTLTSGGSSVFWVSINTKNCAAGTYTTALSASGGSPVTIQINVHDITLPSPSPAWVNTWAQSTREQVPFVFSDWMEKQVDHTLSLGVSVWNGWPTTGTAAALARSKKAGVMFDIGITLSDDPLVLAATVNALVAQAQALGLTYDQWYVELWDEPSVGNAASFGAYCQIIKNTNPNVHIFINPCVWDSDDQQTYDVFGPWYNSLIDISVPDTYSTDRPLSFSLWNAPRFVKAHYHHELDGISEADAEVVRKMAWKSFDLGWNGWGCWTLYGPWPYAPYDDPWTILDEAGNTIVLDHMMAYPGPNGPVGTRRSEGLRAGWEDYCLLTLMRQRGMTSSLNTILANYRNGTALQTLREQMINYLK